MILQYMNAINTRSFFPLHDKSDVFFPARGWYAFLSIGVLQLAKAIPYFACRMNHMPVGCTEWHKCKLQTTTSTTTSTNT